jgi:hypothetical protein
MDRDEEKRRKARQRKKRKALSRVKKALIKAKELNGEEAFTDWENEFAGSLEDKLEVFDSAFVDPEKGRPDEALSYRQAAKLKEIEDKARGKAKKPWNRGGGFSGKKKSKKQPYSWKRQEEASEMPEEEPALDPPRPAGPPKLSVIPGGKKD